MFLFWLLIAYLAGSLPWSVWLGKWWFQIDPREQSDGNPGTANAFRAAGWRLGVSVLFLDFFKAFIPIAIVRWIVRLPDVELFWIALMPTIGHAFSIFLRLQGGRALVVMFGVWAGLTLYLIPSVMGATAIASLFVFKKDEYRTLAIPLILIAFLCIIHAPIWMIFLASAQLLIFAIKIGVIHRQPSVQQKDTTA
jgi:acyl phosphate:glycerol-3-phosphate acyltransferase